jgi:hypothetical protein
MAGWGAAERQVPDVPGAEACGGRCHTRLSEPRQHPAGGEHGDGENPDWQCYRHQHRVGGGSSAARADAP